MYKVLALLRAAIAVVVGLLAAGLVLMAGRTLAFADGAGASPRDLPAGAQLIVLLTWTAAGAAGTWLAALIARRHGPGLVTCAWIFTTVWLSPGVRPAELYMQLACAAAVALAGFASIFLQERYRLPARSAPAGLTDAARRAGA
jgi:hypothetical protein